MDKVWVAINEYEGEIEMEIFSEEAEAWGKASEWVSDTVSDIDGLESIIALHVNGEHEQAVVEFQAVASDYDLGWISVSAYEIKGSEGAAGEAEALKLSLNFTLPHPVKPEVLSWALEGVEQMEQSLKDADSTPLDSTVSLAWVDKDGNVVKDADDLIQDIVSGSGWSKK